MTVTFEKGENSRKKVLDAAFKLFRDQGYENTTMRQIVVRSGVLNGSVYYAFKNKEGILESIICYYVDYLFDNIRDRDLDPMTYLLLAGSLELHYSSGCRAVADLIYHANRSWNIMNRVVDRYMEYFEEYADEKQWVFDREEVRRHVMASQGILYSFCSEYYLTENHTPVRDDLRHLLIYTSSFFRIPVIDTEAVLDNILAKTDEMVGKLTELKF